MKHAPPAEKKSAAVVDTMGPRLQQILQHQIRPWKRNELGEEEAQLAELKRRPVRNRYDAEEAKRRLGLKPAKRTKTSRTKQLPV